MLELLQDIPHVYVILILLACSIVGVMLNGTYDDKLRDHKKAPIHLPQIAGILYTVGMGVSLYKAFEIYTVHNIFRHASTPQDLTHSGIDVFYLFIAFIMLGTVLAVLLVQTVLRLVKHKQRNHTNE
jgi:hypothetical protein